MTIKRAAIVIDANVLISAGILPKSKTAQVLQLAITHFAIAQNDATWSELETRIKRDKFDRYFGVDGRVNYLIALTQSMHWFDISATVRASRDADDDKYLGLAIDAGAKIIISGDADLIDLQKYEDIEIVSPAHFFERYASRDADK
jgi:uncharacterized protein